MKKKLLLITAVFIFLPFVSLADNSESTGQISRPTDATTTIETSKKEELRKQLTDTINTYSAIVNSIQRLSQRVSEREDILVNQQTLGHEDRDAIDSKIENLNSRLEGVSNEVNTSFTKSANDLVESEKPAKPLKEFKKEAGKIKTEIISAHQLITAIIELVKTASLKAEAKSKSVGHDTEASSTDQSN